jgi:hypothetical protein
VTADIDTVTAADRGAHADTGPFRNRWQPGSRIRVLSDFAAERERQLVKWGPQQHPDGTSIGHAEAANHYRALADVRAARGALTWLDILLEEVFEAAAETGAEALRAELVQVGAVATAWIEDIDKRRGVCG